MVWTKMLWRTTLASALAGGFLLLGGATIARADYYDSCHRNVEKWESRLDRDIERHGKYSWQANHDRHELGEARESCERQYGSNKHYHNDHDADDYRQYDRR